MNDSTNQKRVELWKQATHPVYRSFFASAFENKKYSGTKLAVYTRLQHLQNNYSFYKMMNGKSDFDLKKEMQKWNVILFNLSKWKLGEDTSKALGKFVSATLLSIALQRAFEQEHYRKPCYLFVDEFHNLASGGSSMETIFSEARKYKLHLIVGTQSVNQLPVSLKDMVINNTAFKLVGINGLTALKSQSGDLGIAFNVLKTLPPFYFYLKQDHFEAIKIKSPDFLLKSPKKYFLSKKEQAKLKVKVLSQSALYRENENLQSDFWDIWSQKFIESSENFKPKFQL